MVVLNKFEKRGAEDSLRHVRKQWRRNHPERMFTRSLFQTPDIQRQHEILEEAARLIDNGTLRTTLAESLGPINAANLRRAHQMLERGRTIGKLVLEGFS